MSENDDTTQVPQSLTFEALGYLTNHPLAAHPDESQQPETYANELTTNIIKDASKIASGNYDENINNTEIDNTSELNFPQTSKQIHSENTTTVLDKSEYSTSNGTHDDNDFDYEDIQKKMSGVIHDIRSRSGDDTNTSRKSITSNHLHDDQVNDSTPIITDPTLNNPTEGPIRSMSESDLVDHHISTEQSIPLPIRPDESSSDIDDIYGIKAIPTNTTTNIDDSVDQHRSEQKNHINNPLNDDFFNTKTATIDDDQRPSSAIKQNGLNETTRFSTTSPSRVQSAASKRSVHVTPDEPSTSGDEKRTQMSPSKLLDDTDNDTDRDNQEVAIVARRPSRAMSPVNRPRSPTPNDSRKASTTIEPPSSILAEQSQSPTYFIKDDDINQSSTNNTGTISLTLNNNKSYSSFLSDDNQQIFEPPTTIISPASRRESTTNKNDQQQTSRPTSAVKTEFNNEPSTSRPSSSRTSHFLTPDERSKLIKPGEKLQIPTNDFNHERLNSPPPSGIKSMGLINPLLGSNLVQKEQDYSRPSSETNRKSSTTSMLSNEKVIDGDVLLSKSRRDSNLSQQQVNITDQKSTSRHESQIIEQTPQISSSRRSSRSQQQDELDSHREQQAASRRTSNVPQEPTSHRGSFVSEHKTSSRRESTTLEQKPPSRKGSTTSEQQAPSKRASIVSEQQPSSRRESVTDEQKIASRKGSTVSEQQAPSKRRSFVAEQQTSSRRESTTDEQKIASRKGSTASEQQTSSRRGSFVPEQQTSSRRESTTDEQKIASRKGSTTFEQQASSKRGSLVPEQQVSSRRESHVSGQQSSDHRQSLYDQKEEKSSSKPVSRKTSLAEQQQTPSRRESQQQASSSSGRTSTNRDNQLSSPRRSSIVNISPSQESSRRNSSIKQEQQQISAFINKDSRRSSSNTNDTNHQQIKHDSNSSYKEVPSSDTDLPIRTSTKYKQERTLPIDKRQKSSSSIDENDKRRSSFQRRSEQQSKRNSNIITDETVVIPIIMDSSKVRQPIEKRASSTDSTNEHMPTSKLPPVNSLFQQDKPRRSETLTKQQIPISNRLEIKQLLLSRTTTTSDDDQPSHWITQVPVPSVHLTDEEDIPSSSREDQPRPQSPNVKQLAEHNQQPSSPIITSSTSKKRNIADGQKRKEQRRQSRRSTSADSAAQIQLVDGKSLDSTSENTTNFDRHKRRHIKPKKKDVETNTDQTFDLQQRQQRRSFFDEQELTPQKPLKATKPMSDHLHPTRRRIPKQEQTFTTPDTETPTIRRTVKPSKDSNQDKEPVHVNVTVVVKKVAGTTIDGTPRTTAEAFVEQKPQQYFEPVQHPLEILPSLSATTENKEKSEEPIERPKSTEQQQIIKSPKQLIDHYDRHTQSDTEQIITEKQKKRRRPKRISRTCQTYECVFRRMEREQYQDLRVTSDTEKNIQTRKSQLRPRKKSPKKHFPVYLSPDSFRVEELLPKQYHQSRRNISKSSSLARSLSPQGGKLLILRPTLPFHHTDAVSVQRVCLQYAIDLIPNENISHGSTMPTPRNKLPVFKQPEQTNNLPMISASSAAVNIPSNKSNTKEKSTLSKSDDSTHQRKNGGAV